MYITPIILRKKILYLVLRKVFETFLRYIDLVSIDFGKNLKYIAVFNVRYISFNKKKQKDGVQIANYVYLIESAYFAKAECCPEIRVEGCKYIT